MDVGGRLEALLTLAEQCGIEVRAEPMGGDGGGLCTMRGRRVLFVDVSADVISRYERTLAALAPLRELDEHYLLPEARRDLDRQRADAESPDEDEQPVTLKFPGSAG